VDQRVDNRETTSVPPPASLRSNRNFQVFWAGESISLVGSQVSLLALPLTALLVLDASTKELGLLRFIEYLPFLLLALPLGIVADRRRRRPLLILANAARAVLIGSIPILAAVDALHLTVLYVVAFGVGTFAVLFDVCLMAYVPSIVAQEHLIAANSRLSMSLAAAEVSGPGLAGLLVRLLSAPVCLAVNAVSYLISVGSLLMIRSAEPTPSAKRAPWLDLRDGVRFLVGSPALRAVTAAGSLYNLAWILCQTAFLVYANRQLHLDVAVIGVVLAAGASGGIAGAAITPQITRWFPFGRAYLTATVVASFPALLIPAVTVDKTILAILFAALFFIMNGGLGVYNVMTSTLRQTITPNRLLGRVAAGYRMLVFGGLSLGGLAAAGLGGFTTPRATLWVAALGFMAAAIPIMLSPIPRYKRLPDAAS
jgi:MFS family permease